MGLVQMCQAVGTDQIPEELANQLRNSVGGHFNHTFYFSSIAPTSVTTKPGPALAPVIGQTFGSMDDMKEMISNVGSVCEPELWLNLQQENVCSYTPKVSLNPICR
jgi:superoxide dismutase